MYFGQRLHKYRMSPYGSNFIVIPLLSSPSVSIRHNLQSYQMMQLVILFADILLPFDVLLRPSLRCCNHWLGDSTLSSYCLTPTIEVVATQGHLSQTLVIHLRRSPQHDCVNNTSVMPLINSMISSLALNLGLRVKPAFHGAYVFTWRATFCHAG